MSKLSATSLHKKQNLPKISKRLDDGNFNHSSTMYNVKLQTFNYNSNFKIKVIGWWFNYYITMAKLPGQLDYKLGYLTLFNNISSYR